MPVTPPQPIKLPLLLGVLRLLPLPRKLGVLERLYGHVLQRHGTCWVSTAHGICWRLDLTDPCQRWLVLGDYEGSTQMRWVRQWLRDGDVVIDSGANIGQTLLTFASTANTEVYAFEPLPAAADWLRECLEHHPTWRVNVLEYGLSSHRHKRVLQVFGAMSTTRLDWYREEALPSIEIECCSLDEAILPREIQSIRLWKLDVEGGELAALQGAQQLLRSKRIEALLVEVTPSTLPALAEQLQQLGYRFHRIQPHGAPQPIHDNRIDFGHGNLLALPDPAAGTPQQA